MTEPNEANTGAIGPLIPESRCNRNFGMAKKQRSSGPTLGVGSAPTTILTPTQQSDLHLPRTLVFRSPGHWPSNPRLSGVFDLETSFRYSFQRRSNFPCLLFAAPRCSWATSRVSVRLLRIIGFPLILPRGLSLVTSRLFRVFSFAPSRCCKSNEFDRWRSSERHVIVSWNSNVSFVCSCIFFERERVFEMHLVATVRRGLKWSRSIRALFVLHTMLFKVLHVTLCYVWRCCVGFSK